MVKTLISWFACLDFYLANFYKSFEHLIELQFVITSLVRNLKIASIQLSNYLIVFIVLMIFFISHLPTFERDKETKLHSANARQLAVSNIKSYRSIRCDLKTRGLFFVMEAVLTNLLSLLQFLRISPNFQRCICILKRGETINKTKKKQRKLEKINNRLIFKFVWKKWISSFVPRLEKKMSWFWKPLLSSFNKHKLTSIKTFWPKFDENVFSGPISVIVKRFNKDRKNKL